MQERKTSLIPDYAWLAVCLVISSVWCISTARNIGVTYDEPVYLKEGLHHWRSGSPASLMKLGTMPLPVDVQTLPLYIYETSRGAPIDLDTEFHDVLPWARHANLVFWIMLLIYAWFIARHLGGPWAGRLAVTLLAFEPTLLAHASLATTDISVTACLLAFVYHFRVNRDQRWRWRIVWPALFFALAILAKASGLVFGGICMLVVDHQWRASHTEDRPTFRKSYKDMWQIGLLAMLFVFIYCGSDFKPQASFVRWAHQLPDGAFGSTMVWLSENLRLFSNAGEGIARQFSHNVRGHGAYLFGESVRRSFWYYFPVVLSIKLTLPLLLAPILLCFLRIRAPQTQAKVMNWALRCAVALLAFTVFCRVQIGVRLVMPLIAIAVVGLSASLVESIRALQSGWRAQFAKGALAFGVLWTSTHALMIWPNGICFINRAWRQVDDDYQLVSEANLDWGQGLPELIQFQKKHPELPLAVWYYGTDPLSEKLPMPTVKLHLIPKFSEARIRREVKDRYLAVSTTFVGTVIWEEKVLQLGRYFRHLKPVARTSTFLIYDLNERRVTENSP